MNLCCVATMSLYHRNREHSKTQSELIGMIRCPSPSSSVVVHNFKKGAAIRLRLVDQLGILWSGNFFLIAPFPDHCLFLHFYVEPPCVVALKLCSRYLFLAHQIEKSYILPHVRNVNSYLTLVISPRSHPAFKCSFLTLVV